MSAGAAGAAAVGGAGTAGSPSARTRDASTGNALPLDFLDWAIGTPLEPHLEALRAITARADVLAEAIFQAARDSAAAKGDFTASPIDTLKSLGRLRTEGADRRLSTNEREYAALYEPLRAARAAILSACSRPGSVATLKLADVRTDRQALIVELLPLLEVHPQLLSSAVIKCEQALAGGETIGRLLLEAYDELDYTPARKDLRLRILQTVGDGGHAKGLPMEPLYAFAFEPVRQFRSAVAAALTPGAAARMSHGAPRALLSQLAFHANSASMVQLACAGLTRCSMDAVGRPLLAAHLALLVEALRIHKDSAFVVDAVVAVLAMDYGNMEELAVTDRLSHVAAAWAAHKNALRISADCCAIFLKFIQAFLYLDAHVIRSGAVPLLVDAITRHGREKRVAEAAASALQHLLVGGKHGALVATPASASALITVLAMHPKSADIAHAAVGGLRAIIFSDGHACWQAVKAGVIPALVGVLQHHGRAADMAEAACGSLFRIAATDEVGPPASIVAAGGIPRLVAALKTHAAAHSVALAACSALCFLLRTDADYAAVVAAGAVPAVVAAMAAHNGSPKVLIMACTLLSNLAACTGAGACAAICAAGAVPRLMAALRRFTDTGNETGLQHVCRVLHAVASTVGCTPSVAVPAVLAPLVSVVDSYASTADMAGPACETLCGILGCSGPQACKTVAESGGIAAIVKALSLHTSSSALLVSGACQTLATFATVPAHHEALVSSGALEAVVEALQAHADVDRVADGACTLLAHLCAETAYAERAVAAGAIPRIVAALAAHVGSEQEATAACCALVQIAHHPVHASALAAAGALAAAEAAATRHPSVTMLVDAPSKLRELLGGAVTGAGATAAAGAAAPDA